jgi:nicotinate phosphoribosyltransferase
MKLSTGKTNLPGEKQVFRKTDNKERFVEDVIGTADETMEGASPLLELVMQDGKLLMRHPSLEEIRKRFRKNLAALDEKYKALDGAHLYPVKLSARLKALLGAASS